MENNDQQLPTSPDWSTAPNWAQWFAINGAGSGFWFKYRPLLANLGWIVMKTNRSKWQIAPGSFNPCNWQNSLQQRP